MGLESRRAWLRFCVQNTAESHQKEASGSGGSGGCDGWSAWVGGLLSGLVG